MKPTETTIGPATQEKDEQIKAIVAKTMGINPGLILAETKRPTIVWPRQMAMYYVIKCLGLTYEETGYQFNRNHSSIGCAVDACVAAFETNDKPRIKDLTRVGQVLRDNGFAYEADQRTT